MRRHGTVHIFYEDTDASDNIWVCIYPNPVQGSQDGIDALPIPNHNANPNRSKFGRYNDCFHQDVVNGMDSVVT